MLDYTEISTREDVESILPRLTTQPYAGGIGVMADLSISKNEIPIGLCQCGCGAILKVAHYPSWQRRYVHGHNPSATHRQSAIELRFWERVNKDGPTPSHQPELGQCWEFNGSDIGHWGHMRMHVRNRRMRVHRFAWELANGPIQDGLFVLHKCDNGGVCQGGSSIPRHASRQHG